MKAGPKKKWIKVISRVGGITEEARYRAATVSLTLSFILEEDFHRIDCQQRKISKMVNNKINENPWVKPAGPLKVWDIVEGVNKDNGKPVKFSIQEIPEDRYDDVIQHMFTYFLRDEPVCSSYNAKDDQGFLDDSYQIWHKILEDGISVGAFVDNPNGGKPIIAGVNILGVEVKDQEVDTEPYLNAHSTKMIISTMVKLGKEAKVYEHYNVDKYIFAFGLSVNPSYRGQALGEHILKARVKIGKEYNIPVTSTAFTSPISQKLAARSGFEVLLERDYVNILDEEGKMVFPDIKQKTLKVMARRLD